MYFKSNRFLHVFSNGEYRRATCTVGLPTIIQEMTKILEKLFGDFYRRLKGW